MTLSYIGCDSDRLRRVGPLQCLPLITQIVAPAPTGVNKFWGPAGRFKLFVIVQPRVFDNVFQSMHNLLLAIPATSLIGALRLT